MNTNKSTKILSETQALEARHCNGRTYRYAVGTRVGVTTYVMSPEGGALQSYSYTTIKRLGVGTEQNMLGCTTPLAVVEVNGAERTIACRLLDVYSGAHS